jgi:uncharacterized oxidoreductase
MSKPFSLQPHAGRPLAALVTGGSVGLGLALARELADHGCKVVICARTQSDLDAATAADPRLVAIRADVSQAEDRERLMAEAEGLAGHPLDILVNNAAIVRAHDYTSLFTLATDRAAPEIATNLVAPLELARLFLLARHGQPQTPAAILNVSTPGAFFPLDANPLYCATKAAFHMFTLSLRRHLANGPVRVFEVFPPALDTRLADDLVVQSQAAHGQQVIDAVARETVAALAAGEETILPHAQSRALIAMFPQLDPARIDEVNRGVQRRPGWDQE